MNTVLIFLVIVALSATVSECYRCKHSVSNINVQRRDGYTAFRTAETLLRLAKDEKGYEIKDRSWFSGLSTKMGGR